MGANAIGWDIPQTCIYCGTGIYKRAFENLTNKEADSFNLGITLRNSNQRKWLVLECEKCGNVQIFREANPDKPFAWDPPKK